MGVAHWKISGQFGVMNKEFSRFASFKTFPADSVARPIRLAQAGFYYTGSGEEVICFCCGVRNDVWTEDESLLEVHRRLSPKCRYICGADTTNIAIHGDTVSNCSKEMRENFEFKTSESIYDKGSTYAAEQSNEISEDLRNLDVTGISTRHDFTENVTVEHGGTNQECGMAAKFVSSLTNGQIEIYPGISHSRPKHSEYALLSERLASFHEWPARHVADPNVLAKAGFYSAGMQDCVRCFFCNGGMKNWQTGDNPWVEHAKWFPSCEYLKLCKGEAYVNICNSSVNADIVTVYDNESQMDQENCPEDWFIENINSAAAKILLSMGYKQEDVEKGVMFARQKYGPVEIKAQFIMEYMLEANKQCFTQPPPATEKHKMSELVKRKDQPQNGISNATESNGNRSKIKSEKQRLEEENRKLKDLITCKICLDNDACVAFLPCGHLASCVECSKSLRKCAVCRIVVQGTVRVYQA
ncbi:inhibitor of apoptosis protein-like [Mercenaria mercenaria]|uniref:inhibitor of apoptosis protein-like n=1 Tax=Mercenaria mercenaria TaxID=6596 RepID=UPI00234E79DD|nr:inhibitor of apoptosis protein-like [Mercenaria mercenaria]